MPTIKYVSGYEKLKKRKKEEKLIEFQKGSMDKFVISNKQNTTQNLDETIQLQDNNDVQSCNATNLDNELQKNLEHRFFLKSPILVLVLGPKMSRAGLGD